MEQLSLLDLKAKPCPDPEEPKKNSESLSCLLCRPTSNPPVQDDSPLPPKPRGVIPIEEIWSKTPMDMQAEWNEAMVYMEEIRKQAQPEIDELKKELERLKNARDNLASECKKRIKEMIKDLRREWTKIEAEYEEKALEESIRLSEEAAKRAAQAGIDDEDEITEFVSEFLNESSTGRPYIEYNYNKTIEQIFNELLQYYLGKINKQKPTVKPRRPFPHRTGPQILIGRASLHKAEPAPPVIARRKETTTGYVRTSRNTIETVTKHLERLYHITHTWTCFGDAVALMEATLDRFSPGGEERYLEYAKRLGREGWEEAAKIFAILLDHFTYGQNFEDILGPAYMNLAGMGAKSFLGQFFTPWNVALMMAEMTMGERPDKDPAEPIKIYDPACGSGVMLLAGKGVAARRHGREALRRYRFHGTDIDPICVNMCRIQMKMTDDFFMTTFLLASIPDILAAAGNPLQPQGVHFPGQHVQNVEASPGRHQMPF